MTGPPAPARPNEEASTTTTQAGRSLDPDEEALLVRIRVDDLEAFEAFFTRYRGPVYATAYALLGDRQAAEEVLQDTFAKAYEWRRRLHPDASPLPWLHRVALNFSYSRLGRRRVPWEPISEAVARLVRDREAGPADKAEREELRAIVRDGIAALPPKHRGVIVLFYLHGRSIAETAAILDIRPGTVKSRLHFGLRALRARLEEDRRFGGAYEPTRGARAIVAADGEP
ncbi:MAG: RNA polymerase sigma factor [Chloroflexi bacterium]|nr:RNA polymerase sigma factor [Chloroflexota bacterium]